MVMRFTILLLMTTAPVLADDRPNILFAISDDQSFPRAKANLYEDGIRNYAPERWPAGAPRKFGNGNYPTRADLAAPKLGPMHAAYHDIDACPTLSLLTRRHEEPEFARCLTLAVDYRPAEELFDVVADPACPINLAGTTEAAAVQTKLAKQLTEKLKATGDPRQLGDGDVFATYPRYSDVRVFLEPKWAQENPNSAPKQSWLEQKIIAKMEKKR